MEGWAEVRATDYSERFGSLFKLCNTCNPERFSEDLEKCWTPAHSSPGTRI